MTRPKKQQGVVAMITVLIVAAAIVVIAVVANLLGIGELQMGYYHGQHDVMLQATEACVEEAAFRLKKDNSYTSGGFSVGDNYCNLVVTPVGEDRAVSASSTNEGFTSNIDTELSLPTNIAGNAVGADVYIWQEE
ncbi:hypothetical protein GWN26_07840 [Candidatus Saccharibacteria bacterium]|nr:hypothetical protein [Candidatus Saccharibacteria bacterium]